MKSSLPPGPTEPPIVQMIDYVRQPFAFIEKHQRNYGDVFTINLPGIGPQVVIGSPEGLREALSGSYESYERYAEVLRFMLGEHAVIFQEGMPHRRMRKLMGPPFHGDRMRAYGPVMMRVTDEVIARYRDGDTIQVRHEMQEITMRVILHCIFGLDEGPRFDRLKRLLTEFVEAMLTPWVFGAGLVFSGRRVLSLLERMGERQRRANPDSALPLSRLPVQRQADRLGAIDAVLFDEIERCRREPGDRQDILAMLVQSRDEGGQPLTREELRDQLITLMIGGHETTANSLCWALYLLAKHPEVRDAIVREQQTVFPSGFDPLRASQLPYLGAVVQESMRLMPIALGVARRLKHEIELGGYRLPAGTITMPSSYLAQRHPALWERPSEFDPSRFLLKKPAPTAHFPFGGGVWRCLGAAFADYEMRVVLARLIPRFDLSLAPGQLARPLLQGITITPADGLPMQVRSRNTAQPSPSLANQA